MRTLLLAGSMLLAGCIFENDDDRLNIGVQFEIVDPDPTAEPRVIRGPGVIQVDHRFQTPTECANFTASAKQNVSVIEVTIKIESVTGETCPADIKEWRYSAVVTGYKGTVSRIGITRTGGINPGRVEYAIPDEVTLE